jgi:hypothetical protein
MIPVIAGVEALQRNVSALQHLCCNTSKNAIWQLIKKNKYPMNKIPVRG